MKSLVIIFVVLILGIIFISVWNFSSSSNNNGTNYNEISWRMPVKEEIDKVGNSFLNTKMLPCPTYFIKKLKEDKFIIACEGISGTWTYYTVYASQKKAYKTSKDIVANFIPPQVRPERSMEDLTKPSHRLSGKNKRAVNNPSLEAK